MNKCILISNKYSLYDKGTIRQNVYVFESNFGRITIYKVLSVKQDNLFKMSQKTNIIWMKN